MIKKPARSSSRSRSRGRGTRSNRSNTQPAPLPDYLKDRNYKSPYAQNDSGLAPIGDEQASNANNSNNSNNNNNNGNNNLGGNNGGIKQSGHQLKKSTDDLLDLFGLTSSGSSGNSGNSLGDSLFGSMSSNNNNSNNNSNSNANSNSNNNNDDFMNPFASSAPNQMPAQKPRAHAYSAVSKSNNMLKDRTGNNNNGNNNSNNNGNGDSMFADDPFFGDNPFGGGGGGASNGNSNSNSNGNSKSKGKGKSKNKKPKHNMHAASAGAGAAGSSEEEDEKDTYSLTPRPEHPPPKPKARSRQTRSKTDAVIHKPSKNAPDPPKKVKTKSIDVLPLLHAGVKANKFKFGQGKSKVRTFYLTKDNQWFCWEPVGGPLQGKNNRKKIDPTRSIFIRSIREVKKNSTAMVQDLNFIPAQHKGLTISIVYDLKGTEKKVNLMAYEPFHHVLVFEALTKLSAMGQNINRDLGNVFELYVDFEKEILPKHLRPQRFKWEPLGQKEIDTAEKKEEEDPTAAKTQLETIDAFYPTDKRNRLKSF